MQNFKPSEFREWYDLMHPRLLTMLDVLRFRLGLVITISGHPDALGRYLGPDSESAHNYDYWGWVYAVDCFIGKNTTYRDAKRIFQEAKSIGFTGIGIYPFWTNNDGHRQCGFHLDVRPTKQMGDPATWGKIGPGYVSSERALQELVGL